MRIMYTRPSDGGLDIVVAAPKEAIERILGPLTDEQYAAHVFETSVPGDAINARVVPAEGIPTSREFRNAWVDVTEQDSVDIDLVKAKELKLNELRAVRNTELASLDPLYLKALELNDQVELARIAARKQELRDATDPLKNLTVQGVNDEEVLNTIRNLSVLI